MRKENVTIVMPFYKKYKEFNLVFSKYNKQIFNRYRNLELIISADDPFEVDKLIDFCHKEVQNSQINFSIKIFVKRDPHAWRPPSKAINVGIKRSTFEKIIVISPETIVLPGSIESLVKHAGASSFSSGIIKHTNYSSNLACIDEMDQYFNLLDRLVLPYGSVCFCKTQALKVRGYNESFKIWGGDDDDFRCRLQKAGYRRASVFAKFLHCELDNEFHNRAPDKEKMSSVESLSKKLKEIMSNERYSVNSSGFGEDFNEIGFEYSPKISEPIC